MRAATLCVALLLAATSASAQGRPVTIDDVLGIRVVRDTVMAPKLVTYPRDGHGFTE